jgi:hypothetical protein
VLGHGVVETIVLAGAKRAVNLLRFHAPALYAWLRKSRRRTCC